MLNKERRPVQGVGLGLRQQHIADILTHRPAIAWFEVLVDNHLVESGPLLRQLELICENYPIVFHSVGASIGSTDELDMTYLDKIKRLQERFAPQWLSEHLCWSSVHGIHFHDLLPLPYTDEVVRHVAGRIDQIQQFFGESILIENVSSYLSFQQSTMSEWEFVSEVVERAQCYLLLDVNNIHVSAHNHNFNPHVYLEAMPLERVKQIHLGGFEDCGDYYLDNHGSAPSEPVMQLYRDLIRRVGSVPTLLEWDVDLPELNVLLDLVAHIDNVQQEASGESAPAPRAIL